MHCGAPVKLDAATRQTLREGNLYNLTISKMLFGLVATLCAAFSAVLAINVSSSTDATYQQRYDLIRTEVDTGISILAFYHRLAEAGEMPEIDAKAAAFRTLAEIRYEPSGYLFG